MGHGSGAVHPHAPCLIASVTIEHHLNRLPFITVERKSPDKPFGNAGAPFELGLFWCGLQPVAPESGYGRQSRSFSEETGHLCDFWRYVGEFSG